MAITFFLSSTIDTLAFANIAPVLALVTMVRTSTPQTGVAKKISSFPFLLLEKKPKFLALLNEKEKTLPTHHEKIKIAKVVSKPYNEVLNEIENLTDLCRELNSKCLIAGARRCLKPPIRN